MASERQVSFFNNLLEDREFPTDGPSVGDLRTRFSTLDQDSASQWIEKAMGLPKRGATPPDQQVAPPF
jgi:hypothetical protein